jgi:hypothetical protein
MWDDCGISTAYTLRVTITTPAPLRNQGPAGMENRFDWHCHLSEAIIATASTNVSDMPPIGHTITGACKSCPAHKGLQQLLTMAKAA